MAESRLPEPVRELLRSDVPTLAHLDALIALAGESASAHTVAELAGQLGADADSVARVARELAASGLLVAGGRGGEAEYRFDPASPRAAAVQALAEMYRRFPVQVVRAVYERPAAPVQQLADAFLLRKPQ